MAKTDITTIKNWFTTGLKPSQIQFWNTWDSFWHKDEKIPISSIEDLGNAIDNKSDVNHTHSNYATNNAESLTATNVEQWKEKLGVADLKFDDESITITQPYSEFNLQEGDTINAFNNAIYEEVNKKLNAPIENNTNEYVLLADGTTAPKTDFGKVDTVMGVQAGANKNVDISDVAMNWSNPSQRMSALPDKSLDATFTEIIGADSLGNLGKVGSATLVAKLQTATSAEINTLFNLLNGQYTSTVSQIRVTAFSSPYIVRNGGYSQITVYGTGLLLMYEESTYVRLISRTYVDKLPIDISYVNVSGTEMIININTELLEDDEDLVVEIVNGIQRYTSIEYLTAINSSRVVEIPITKEDWVQVDESAGVGTELFISDSGTLIQTISTTNKRHVTLDFYALGIGDEDDYIFSFSHENPAMARDLQCTMAWQLGKDKHPLTGIANGETVKYWTTHNNGSRRSVSSLQLLGVGMLGIAHEAIPYDYIISRRGSRVQMFNTLTDVVYKKDTLNFTRPVFKFGGTADRPNSQTISIKALTKILPKS